MTDVDPQGQAYMDALAPEKPAPETPEERYVKQLRAGGGLQEAQELQTSPAARGPDGRFVKAEQPKEAEQSQPLTPAEATDYLLGRQPSEIELAEREQAQAEQDLQDGTVAKQLVEEHRVVREMGDKLKKACPGIDSPEFLEMANPVAAEIEANFPGATGSPVLWEQVYEELGGAEKWGPDPQAEAWSERGLKIFKPDNAFTR